ncbi:hypothetical protein PR048_021910 [Dryococelus australis]|uniref:Uncharacterized protein n=1 Tax=Dryococelus australis TaxID=614101 RepID=A0ABQ9GZJ1_9NEOP|nr:hypothetical protein PR048_021910 [Dryococelus australis]
MLVPTPRLGTHAFRSCYSVVTLLYSRNNVLECHPWNTNQFAFVVGAGTRTPSACLDAPVAEKRRVFRVRPRQRYLASAEARREVLLQHAEDEQDGPADGVRAAVIAVYSSRVGNGYEAMIYNSWSEIDGLENVLEWGGVKVDARERRLARTARRLQSHLRRPGGTGLLCCGGTMAYPRYSVTARRAPRAAGRARPFIPGNTVVEPILLLLLIQRRTQAVGLNVSSTARSLEKEQVAQGRGIGEGMGRNRPWPLLSVPSQHSPGVISGNHGKPKSGWPDRESNPGPPERASSCYHCNPPLGHYINVNMLTCPNYSDKSSPLHTTGATTTRLPPKRAWFDSRRSRGFPLWVSCVTMPLVGAFSRDLPFPSSLAFRRRFMLTSLHPCRLSRPPPSARYRDGEYFQCLLSVTTPSFSRRDQPGNCYTLSLSYQENTRSEKVYFLIPNLLDCHGSLSRPREDRRVTTHDTEQTTSALSSKKTFRSLPRGIGKNRSGSKKLGTREFADRRCRGGRGGVVVRLLTLHPGEPGSIPGGVVPACGDLDGRCRWLGGFSRGSPVPPALTFRCRSPSTALETSIYHSLHAEDVLTPHARASAVSKTETIHRGLSEGLRFFIRCHPFPGKLDVNSQVLVLTSQKLGKASSCKLRSEGRILTSVSPARTPKPPEKTFEEETRGEENCKPTSHPFFVFASHKRTRNTSPPLGGRMFPRPCHPEVVSCLRDFPSHPHTAGCGLSCPLEDDRVPRPQLSVSSESDASQQRCVWVWSPPRKQGHPKEETSFPSWRPLRSEGGTVSPMFRERRSCYDVVWPMAGPLITSSRPSLLWSNAEMSRSTAINHSRADGLTPANSCQANCNKVQRHRGLQVERLEWGRSRTVDNPRFNPDIIKKLSLYSSREMPSWHKGAGVRSSEPPCYFTRPSSWMLYFRLTSRRSGSLSKSRRRNMAAMDNEQVTLLNAEDAGG